MSVVTPPFVVNIAGAAASESPPVAAANLVLVMPLDMGGGAQVFALPVGPNAQLGSTPGVDTNDPTYVAGPPARFTFDATDYVTWGDVLDEVFSGGAGWSIVAAINPSAGDVAADRQIMNKHAAGQAEFAFGLTNVGNPALDVYYGGTEATSDRYRRASALSEGRQVLGCTFNPALARNLRGRVYLNGADVTDMHTTNGADGTISDTGAELRLGMRSQNSEQGLAEMGWVYIWDIPLTAQQMADAVAWIVANGWS